MVLLVELEMTFRTKSVNKVISNSVDKVKLKEVLKKILLDQGDKKLFQEPQNKLFEFKTEIHDKGNKIKGMGA